MMNITIRSRRTRDSNGTLEGLPAESDAASVIFGGTDKAR